MRNDPFRQILELLRRLEDAKIAYSLEHSRDDALTILADVPGQRWEIEFVDYGDDVHVEIERFVSNGHIDDESALEKLFTQFSDQDEPVTDHATTRK